MSQTPSLATGTVRTGAVLCAICTASFVVMMDTTIVNVALPSIAVGLHASIDQLLWFVNCYILIYAALLITCARLGDLVGPRTVMICGLCTFGVASALCGLARTPAELILARVLEGLGGAMITPQSMSLITLIFPRDRRGAAFGASSATMALAALCGPVIGGILVTVAGWRWVFFVNVPIIIIAITLALRFIPALRPGRRHAIDWPGVVLAAGGFGVVVFALTDGQQYGWGTVAGPVSVPAILIAGLLMLAVFAWWEHRHPEPLLPLGLFGHRGYTAGTVRGAANVIGMYGITLIATLHLQSVMGLSALQTGLAYVPMAVMTGVLAPVAGRLTDKIGASYLLTGGFLGFAAAVGWLLSVVNLHSTTVTFSAPLALVGAALGFTMAPNTAQTMREIGPQLVGAASGAFSTIGTAAGAMGIAITGLILQNRLTALDSPGSDLTARVRAAKGAFVGAEHVALLVLVIMLVVVAVLSLPGRVRQAAAEELPVGGSAHREGAAGR